MQLLLVLSLPPLKRTGGHRHLWFAVHHEYVLFDVVCAWWNFILGFAKVLHQIVRIPLIVRDFVAQFSCLVECLINLLTRLEVLLLHSRLQMHLFYLSELLNILPVEVLHSVVFAEVISEKLPGLLDHFFLELNTKTLAHLCNFHFGSLLAEFLHRNI